MKDIRKIIKLCVPLKSEAEPGTGRNWLKTPEKKETHLGKCTEKCDFFWTWVNSVNSDPKKSANKFSVLNLHLNVYV